MKNCTDYRYDVYQDKITISSYQSEIQRKYIFQIIMAAFKTIRIHFDLNDADLIEIELNPDSSVFNNVIGRLINRLKEDGIYERKKHEDDRALQFINTGFTLQDKVKHIDPSVWNKVDVINVGPNYSILNSITSSFSKSIYIDRTGLVKK